MINWRVYLKNPTFWAKLLLAVMTPIGGDFGLTGADMTTWEKVWDTFQAALSNPYVVALVVISVWNTLNGSLLSVKSENTGSAKQLQGTVQYRKTR